MANRLSEIPAGTVHRSAGNIIPRMTPQRAPMVAASIWLGDADHAGLDSISDLQRSAAEEGESTPVASPTEGVPIGVPKTQPNDRRPWCALPNTWVGSADAEASKNASQVELTESIEAAVALQTAALTQAAIIAAAEDTPLASVCVLERAVGVRSRLCGKRSVDLLTARDILTYRNRRRPWLNRRERFRVHYDSDEKRVTQHRLPPAPRFRIRTTARVDRGISAETSKHLASRCARWANQLPDTSLHRQVRPGLGVA